MRRFVILASFLLLLGACARAIPIHNVDNADVFTGSGKIATQADVRKAIMQALAAKLWKIKEIDSDTIEASNTRGNSTAWIEINYSTKQYSINYKDSTKFLYKNGRIHRRYNGWIVRLEKQIELYLSLI